MNGAIVLHVFTLLLNCLSAVPVLHLPTEVTVTLVLLVSDCAVAFDPLESPSWSANAVVASQKSRMKRVTDTIVSLHPAESVSRLT